MASNLGLQGALSTGATLSGNLAPNSTLAGQLSIGIYRKGYVWIKWCETEPNESSVLLDTAADYIGIYSSDHSVASTNYLDYTWYKYKGEIGASAYQIWLSQGNTGTEADFIYSLQAKGYQFVDTHSQLPVEGDPAMLYFVREENCIYSYLAGNYNLVQSSALTNLLNIIQLNGDGSKVLTDNGTYVTLHQTDNNYTTPEKNKLSGIESGAQINKIEKVIYNGAEVPITNKTVTIDEEYQIHQYPNFDSFPNLGKKGWLYLDQQKGVTWRWDETALLYYVTGADYTKINIINGGIANG